MEIPLQYCASEVESKWYSYWLSHKLFASTPDSREPYTIVIPPPNVTGVLHMGHMLNNTIQDVLIRRARMKGFNACWVPGTDHASIATEAKVVQKLTSEGIEKSSLSREEFLKHAWDWTEKHGGLILNQLQKLGASCDWDRTCFTMDEERSKSVIKVFVSLYNKGLIYRGVRMVNWDPQAKTAVSDEEVYYKEGNIIDNLRKGKIVIDMTTSSPKLAKRIYQDVKKKGGFSLDAPVTGGDKGAIEGTLVIFVGGDKKAYEKCLPVFKGMGTTILYTGEAGSGQHSKLANQISIAGAISGMAETISYAKKAGLEVAPLIEVWSKGSAGSWQMQNLGPKALVNDFRPGFYIKHFIKDMNLAIDEAKENNLDLKMLTTVRDMFEELSKLGYDECGTQALIDYYNRKS